MYLVVTFISYKMASQSWSELRALRIASIYLFHCEDPEQELERRENNKYLQLRELRELSKYWLDGTIWLCLSGPALIPPLLSAVVVMRNIYLLCFQILEILSEYEGAVFVAILHNMSD